MGKLYLLCKNANLSANNSIAWSVLKIIDSALNVLMDSSSRLILTAIVKQGNLLINFQVHVIFAILNVSNVLKKMAAVNVILVIISFQQ